MYDPQIGRWHCIDPMAVFTPGISPYSYADDNPVNYIDYYGLGVLDWFKKKITNWKINRANNKRIRQARRNAKPRGRGKPYNPNLHTIPPHAKSCFNKAYQPHPLTYKDYKDPISALLPSQEPSMDMVYTPPSPPKPKPPTATEFEGTGIYLKPIRFKVNTSEIYKIPQNAKIIYDLIITLKESPELMVIIKGNVRDEYLKQPSNDPGLIWAPGHPDDEFDGIPGMPVGNMMLRRAGAIKHYLEMNGIDPSRIKTETGTMYPGIEGYSTEFELE